MDTGTFAIGSHVVAIRGFLPDPNNVSNHSVVVRHHRSGRPRNPLP